MADLTVQVTSLAGLDPTYTAVNASDAIPNNNGRIILHVKNGAGAPVNVTIDDPGSQSPEGATQFNPDVVVAVPAGDERIIGPFRAHRFNDANGKVQVAYSAQTDITAAALRLPE